MKHSRSSCHCRKQVLVGSWSGRRPAKKEEACGRSAEWAKELEKSCKQAGLCNQIALRTARWVDSSTNENNGNAVQASRQSSITNNETTTTYQIPWHLDVWQLCSTSCNYCNGATSSAPFGCCSYYTTRYHDYGRTKSVRMMQQLLRKNTMRWNQQEYHQPATTAKKYANDMIFSNRRLWK